MPCIVTCRDHGRLRHLTVDTSSTWEALQTAHDHGFTSATSARVARPGESLPATTLTPPAVQTPAPTLTNVHPIRPWIDTQPETHTLTQPATGAFRDEHEDAMSSTQMVGLVLLSALLVTAAAALAWSSDLAELIKSMWSR